MRDNGWTDDMNDATPDWEAEQEYLAGLRTLDDPWPGEESPESDNYMHRLFGVLLGAFAVHTIIMGTLLLLVCSE